MLGNDVVTARVINRNAHIIVLLSIHLDGLRTKWNPGGMPALINLEDLTEKSLPEPINI